MRNKILFLSTDFQLEKVCSFIFCYEQVSPYAKGCSIFKFGHNYKKKGMNPTRQEVIGRPV